MRENSIDRQYLVTGWLKRYFYKFYIIYQNTKREIYFTRLALLDTIPTSKRHHKTNFHSFIPENHQKPYVSPHEWIPIQLDNIIDISEGASDRDVNRIESMWNASERTRYYRTIEMRPRSFWYSMSTCYWSVFMIKPFIFLLHYDNALEAR